MDLKFIKYIFVSTILLFAVSTILSLPEALVGEYINSSNPSFIRIKAQLPTISRYISIYSVFILVFLLSYVFLDNKYNASICNLIEKLEGPDHPTLQNNKSSLVIDRRSLLFLSMFSLCVVALRNWSSVLHGYFKYDDFEFFSTNRTEPLLSLLVTPHGDHLLPLYRLEVATMNFLFGVNPIYYNLFVSSLFVLLLIFVGLLLREMRAGQLTIVLFAILCMGWIDWGEIAAGYFCISIYVQITLLSVISIWSYYRWTETLATIFKLLTITCIGIALFLDLSGVWVPIAVIIFSFNYFSSDRINRSVRDWFKSHRWLLAAVVTIYILFAMLNWFVFFVSKHGVFLSMSGNSRHTLFSFLLQTFYLISGGLLLTPFFPIGFNLLPPVILILLLAVLFVLATYIVFRTLKNSGMEVRRHIYSVLFVILMTVTIIVIGRPMVGFSYALVAKYIGVPYLWFCLLCCLIWNHHWQRQNLPGKSRMATLSLLLLLCFIGQQLLFDNILFLSKSEGAGYIVNTEEARTRKNNVDEIKQRLILPLLASQNSELHIPSLDGNNIFNIYPKLFKYNLSHYLDFVVPKGERVVLYKNKAMQTWAAKDVVTVTSLRSNIDKIFVKYLENDMYAQLLYLSPVELSSNTVLDTTFKTYPNIQGPLESRSAISYQQGGYALFHSNGRTELIVDRGVWDPETRHLLVLNVEYQGNSMADSLRLDVNFSGELKIPYSKNFVIIPSRKKCTISIDLLQIYAYSLNQQVGNLRIGFPVSGKYLVSGVTLI